jgi:hypoxanthine phosphoribosyltransferase
MTYTSLFERIELTKEFQIYEGSLESVFNEVITILKKEIKSKRDYSILAFHPPRIIRALVDYKEEQPDSSKNIELLKEGITTSLDIYSQYNHSSTIENVLALREKLDEKILKRIIKQQQDDINLVVSNPKFSQATANKLYEIINNKEAIMFVVGHGGTGPGLDVILRYRELSHQNNLEFYPVRFSRSEHKGYKDTKPCLTETEIEYLRKEVMGKKVIVFDENHNTGRNIRTVAEFISREIAPDQKVEMIYNVNTGIPGEWAELYKRLK